MIASSFVGVYDNFQTLEIHAKLTKIIIILWINTILELGKLIVSLLIHVGPK